MTGCSEKQRSTCLAWTSFKDNLEEMEDIQCWIIKGYASEGECVKSRKCKKCNYYLAMNRNSGIASEIDADTAIITCEGTLNNDSTAALEKVWENLKKNGKFKVILDITRVNNIYSCGLGMLVRIHKEAIEGGGALVVAGPGICPGHIYKYKTCKDNSSGFQQNSRCRVFRAAEEKEGRGRETGRRGSQKGAD